MLNKPKQKTFVRVPADEGDTSTTSQPAKDKGAKVYFENLNTIRFIAALMVVIHHVEQFRSIMGVPGQGNKVIGMLGKLGVVLFFVLSGYLISYLLFKEKEVTNDVNIKNFYIRRILRIWPLYYLIVLSSLFVLPFFGFIAMPGYDLSTIWNDLGMKLFLFVFFMPNVVLFTYGIIPYASQTWSIGAEEQFYLIWPALNKKTNRRWLLMGVIIFGYMALKYAGIYAFPKGAATTFFNKYWESTPFDCMAIGGLFALIAFEKSRIANTLRQILYHKVTQWFFFVATVWSIGSGLFIFYYLHYEYYAILFGILILIFAANKNRIFSME